MHDTKELSKTLAKDYISVWNWKEPNKLFNLCPGQAVTSSFLLLRSATGCLIRKCVKNTDLLDFQGYTYSCDPPDTRGNFNKNPKHTVRNTPDIKTENKKTTPPDLRSGLKPFSKQRAKMRGRQSQAQTQAVKAGWFQHPSHLAART